MKDPVCGMGVEPGHAAGGSAERHGRAYWFCNPACREKFLADPGRYLEARTDVSRAADTRIYTCPMHPEVRQIGPGNCPKCGMALEPLEVAAADEGPGAELVDMTWRFWVSLALTVPVLAVAMSEMVAPPLADRVSPTVRLWVQLVFSAPVVLWGGWPFFVRGWQSIVTRNLNMFTLIALGTGVAYVYSLVATLAPGFFPASMLQHGVVPVYFEPAAVIVSLVLLGQVLELRARARTRTALKALLGLAPKTARLIRRAKTFRGAKTLPRGSTSASPGSTIGIVR